MKVHICVVCGNIGAGKSTLLTNIKKLNDESMVFLEPVEEWAHFLARTYQTVDDSHSLFMLQSLVLAHYTRVTAQLEEIVATATQPLTIFVERCPAEALYVFLPLNRTRFCENDYLSLVHMHTRLVENLVWSQWAEYIVLRAPSQVCMDRIHERSRNGECRITTDYLKRLSQLQVHEFVNRLPPSRTRYLDSSAHSPEELAQNVMQLQK